MATRQTLDVKILAAFKQACAEGRLDVADHLLRALEILDARPKPGSPLEEAYFSIAAAPKGRKRPRRPH